MARGARPFWLSHPALGGRGRGVRLAIIDSGVHATHPHVQGVAGGVSIDSDGHVHDDIVDRLGHGTAVTAVIREKAPEAEILVVKVFDRELRASAQTLLHAIEWAIKQRVHLVNLSLGTADHTREREFGAAVAAARTAGTWIVAAIDRGETQWLPGRLSGIVGVEVDWTLPRETSELVMDGATIRARASGYPRPIPGVAPEQNLRGVSFAVANATGLLAQLLSEEDSLGPTVRSDLMALHGALGSLAQRRV